jgi:hypothetical protein
MYTMNNYSYLFFFPFPLCICYLIPIFFLGPFFFSPHFFRFYLGLRFFCIIVQMQWRVLCSKDGSPAWHVESSRVKSSRRKKRERWFRRWLYNVALRERGPCVAGVVYAYVHLR